MPISCDTLTQPGALASAKASIKIDPADRLWRRQSAITTRKSASVLEPHDQCWKPNSAPQLAFVGPNQKVFTSIMT